MSSERKSADSDSTSDVPHRGISRRKARIIKYQNEGKLPKFDTAKTRYYGRVCFMEPVKSDRLPNRIYILTTEGRSRKNKYKVGSHKGSQKKLESRYVTPLINPIICFFHPTEYANIVESTFKQLFRDDRIINKNGTRTEWIIMDKSEIIAWLNDIDETYQETLLDWDNCNINTTLS